MHKSKDKRLKGNHRITTVQLSASQKSSCRLSTNSPKWSPRSSLPAWQCRPSLSLPKIALWNVHATEKNPAQFNGMVSCKAPSTRRFSCKPRFPICSCMRGTVSMCCVKPLPKLRIFLPSVPQKEREEHEYGLRLALRKILYRKWLKNRWLLVRKTARATPGLCTLEMAAYRVTRSWTDCLVPLRRLLLNLRRDEWVA